MRDQRRLPDEVAIQYTIPALGGHSLGRFPLDYQIELWETFIGVLKPMFCRTLRIGTWLRFHSIGPKEQRLETTLRVRRCKVLAVLGVI